MVVDIHVVAVVPETDAVGTTVEIPPHILRVRRKLHTHLDKVVVAVTDTVDQVGLVNALPLFERIVEPHADLACLVIQTRRERRGQVIIGTGDLVIDRVDKDILGHDRPGRFGPEIDARPESRTEGKRPVVIQYEIVLNAQSHTGLRIGLTLGAEHTALGLLLDHRRDNRIEIARDHTVIINYVGTERESLERGPSQPEFELRRIAFAFIVVNDITNVGKHERIHFGHLDTVTHIAQRRHAETEAEPFGQRNLHTDIPDIKSVIAGLRIGRLRIDIVHLATDIEQHRTGIDRRIGSRVQVIHPSAVGIRDADTAHRAEKCRALHRKIA